MLRSSHDACGCSTQTTSTINLKRSTLHPHEGQADRPNTPSDSVNLGSQVPQPGIPVFSGASPIARKSARLAGVTRRHPVSLPCRTRVEALFGDVSGAGLCGAFWNLRAALEPRCRDRVRLAWRLVRSCDTPFPSAATQASGCDPAAQTDTVVCCVCLPQVWLIQAAQLMPSFCSCSAQLCGRARASDVTVRPAGAGLLAIASTIRGDK